MDSTCPTPNQLKALLAGELPAAEEENLTRHLEDCEVCERRAAELSDDAEARRLAAIASQGGDSDPAALEDLRRRLHVLGWFEPATAADPAGARAATVTLASRLTGATPLPFSMASSARPSEPPLPPQLGHFRILRQIGSGGFGIVYLAHDLKLDRPVALKAARASILAEPGQRERFFREAQALARLRHPHIIPVYEAGEIEGICFLVMAWCEGPALDEHLRQCQGRGEPVTPDFAARLVLCLADAVQHAHDHGILHRDIKPANVLLAAGDRDLPFTPLLTDFGLAKIAEEPTTATLSGMIFGTPQYMAPEQAACHAGGIGPTADVYALGAVLYEALTGQPPIQGSSLVDTLRRLVIEEPVDVRHLAPDVPEDLAAIAMKCLEKSPGERYATAAELADDLRRFLAGRPTKARPLPLERRVRRFIAANKLPVAVAALSLIAVALAAGLFAYAHLLSRSQNIVARYVQRWDAIRDETEALHEEAERRARNLAEQRYVDDVGEAARRLNDRDVAAAVTALARHIPADGQDDLREFSWHYLWALATHEPLASQQRTSPTYFIARCPTRLELAVVGKDGVIRLYDPRQLKLLAEHDAGQGELNGVAYSPDGSLLATVGDDGEVRLWQRSSFAPAGRWKAHPDLAFNVLFLDGGSKLVTCGDDPVIKLWDATTHKLIGTLEGHTEGVEAIALSPDGTLLASASRDNVVMLWDWRSQKSAHRLEGHSRRVMGIAFSPDGRLLATAAGDKEIRLWDSASGRCVGTREQIDDVQSVAFSADGQRLYVGDRKGKLGDYVLHRGEDGAVTLENELLDDIWLGHHGVAWFLLPATEPGRFYSCGHDGGLKLWGPHSPQERVVRIVEAEAGDPICDLGFSADGERLFLLRQHSGVAMLDAATLETVRAWDALPADWQSLAVLEGRDEVAAGSTAGDLLIWNWRTGERRKLVDPAGPFNIWRLCYSAPSGLLAVVPYGADGVRVYDMETDTLVRVLPAINYRTAAFSPDGTLLAADSLTSILLYDPVSGAKRDELTPHASTILGLAFSPDGKLLVSGSDDRTVHLWSLVDEPATSLAHTAPVIGVAFTPDGKSLVSADEQGGLTISYPPPRHGRIEIPLPDRRLKRLAVAPDNRRIVLVDSDGNLLIVGVQRGR